MPNDASQVADPREAPRSRRAKPGTSPSTSPPDDVTGPQREPVPATSLLDPRVLQILNAEHSSLLSARSLAYNEAFTRGLMFLSFLSMSFVGIALVAQAIPVGGGFLVVVAVVLGFDLVVGLTTYGRIISANYEDYRTVHGMARIRHGYGEIAPIVLPYLTTSVHDDLTGVMVTYGSPPTVGLGALVYQLTTSSTMVGLIVSMTGGLLALVVALGIGAPGGVAVIAGVLALVGVFVILGALTIRFYLGVQARLEVLFPTPTGTDLA